METRGGFVGNLGKIYAIYTGGFIGFVILMAILEQLGVPTVRSVTCSSASPSRSTR